MPYISQEQRDKYFHLTTEIDKLEEIETKGDLEFLVFYLMKKFMKTRERKYNTLHDAVYATVHSAHEFERRHLDIRENEAREQNGDI